MSEQTLDPEDARHTQNNRVCSGCYEPVVATYDHASGIWTIRCNTDGCPCHGTISKKTLELRKQQDHSDFLEARRVLSAFLPGGKRTEAQLLQSMGF